MVCKHPENFGHGRLEFCSLDVLASLRFSTLEDKQPLDIGILKIPLLKENNGKLFLFYC